MPPAVVSVPVMVVDPRSVPPVLRFNVAYVLAGRLEAAAVNVNVPLTDDGKPTRFVPLPPVVMVPVLVRVAPVSVSVVVPISKVFALVRVPVIVVLADRVSVPEPVWLTL